MRVEIGLLNVVVGSPKLKIYKVWVWSVEWVWVCSEYVRRVRMIQYRLQILRGNSFHWLSADGSTPTAAFRCAIILLSDPLELSDPVELGRKSVRVPSCTVVSVGAR